MKITMSEIESDQFNKMFRQHGEMYEIISELKEVLIGDDIYKRPGIIQKISDLENTVKAHDKKDSEQFAEIFEFQNKQKYLVGWSGIVVRALGGGVVILIGWLISVFFK